MTPSPTTDPEASDRRAILLMLTYVEAECLRLGLECAAHHAALAAALVPAGGLPRAPLPAKTH